MRRAAVLLLVFSVFLIGCGGTNGSNNNVVSNSPFQGTYIGPYSVSGGAQAGNVTGMSVNILGEVQGTMTATNASGVAGNLGGLIGNDGTAAMSLTNFSPTQYTVSGLWTLNGTALTGTLTFTPNGGSPVVYTFNLTKQ